MTLQAGNYCTHAIEQFSRYTAGDERDLVPTLRHAEKFMLPHNGDLLDVSSMRAEFFDLLRLPYPIVALEFTASYLDDIDGKTIILALQDEKDGHISWCTLVNTDGQWIYVPIRGDIDPKMAGEQIRAGEHAAFHFGKTERSSLSDAIRDETARKVARDGLHVLLEFCCTVNCENVATEVIPAPEKLNKKRIANGREPFDSYRVLTLAKSTSGPRLELGGTHASPRLHLRRGHLRRLQSGKVIWIRHCMVGNPDKGVVEKVYQVA